MRSVLVFVELDDGVIPDDEGKTDLGVGVIQEISGSKDDLLGLVGVELDVVHGIGHVGLLGQDLGEDGALVELEVLNLEIVRVDTLVDPELAPVVVDHVGLLVQDGNTYMHIAGCHVSLPLSDEM